MLGVAVVIITSQPVAAWWAAIGTGAAIAFAVLAAVTLAGYREPW